MRATFPKASLALLCALTPFAAWASPYEQADKFYAEVSEVSNYVFNRKVCEKVDHASVQEKLRASVEATCEAGALHEANLILNNPYDLSDALFFEAARQELYEEATCSVKKVDALMATPAAFQIFKDSLLVKVPELKRLERELRDLDGIIGHYEETLPRQKLTGVGKDGKEIPAEDDGWNETRRYVEELKKRREKTEEALDGFRDTIPFSGYGFVKKAIAKMPAEPGKNDRTKKDFDKAVFKMMKELQKRLPEQAKLVHPGQSLSITAKEDVVQDEDFFTSVLDKYPFTKEEKDSYACRLDARYGKGRESLDNVLIIGSTIAFGPWGMLGGGSRAAVSGASTATKMAAAAARVQTVGARFGRYARLAATGLILADSFRDVERLCTLTSPDHHATAEGKKTAPGCGADDVIEELYEKDCASYLLFWGLAFNSGRKAQKLLGSELVRRLDAQGIKQSDRLLNVAITKDMLDMYVLPDKDEEDKKEKKADAKKEREKHSAGAAPEASGASGGSDEADDSSEEDDSEG